MIDTRPILHNDMFTDYTVSIKGRVFDINKGAYVRSFKNNGCRYVRIKLDGIHARNIKVNKLVSDTFRADKPESRHTDTYEHNTTFDADDLLQCVIDGDLSKFGLE